MKGRLFMVGRESETSWILSVSGIGYGCSSEESSQGGRDNWLGGMGDKSGLEMLEKEYDIRLQHWQRYPWQRHRRAEGQCLERLHVR